MDILIAGVSARGLVESAVRSGLPHRIIAVDYFGDFDLQLLCESRSIRRDLGLPYSPQHLVTLAGDLTCDALAYVANLENHPSVVELLRRGKPVLGNRASVLSSVRDPARFFGFLERAGIPSPKICFPSAVSDLDPNTRWLRKPERSGGGHGIAFHAPGTRVEPGVFFQEYVDGLACSAVFVADGLDCTLLGISEQLVGEKEFGADGFRYCGSILGPVVQRRHARWPEIIKGVREIVRAIAREFHLVGANGMDFILKERAIYPLEINPRYTASMELVERAYGINIFGAHLAACQGMPSDFDLGAHTATAPDYLGKAVVFATGDLIFHDPGGWYEHGARDLPPEGERIGRGKPVCTVFSRGHSRQECHGGLTKVAAELQSGVHREPNPVEQVS